MNYKEVLPEQTPACEIPYRSVNQPFRLKFVIPGPGIRIMEDANGVCYISAVGGMSLEDLVAGDNIEINRTEDGKMVISSVNTATNIAAGQNISIDIDPQTGTAIINSIIGGPTNEHYKGVFDSPEDLIAADPDPETGDYGMVKNIVITNGEASWNGQYKYCFYINGQWTVVDQMLTFTKDLDLLQQYYSVGGSSPVIYLHEVARSGDFWDLNNIPIVATPLVSVVGNTVTATCATEDAEIWYSTDGSMPHVNGTKYTGPITASGATTYRFVGIKNGMINSLEAVASADYELEAPSIELNWHDGTVTMYNSNEDGGGNPVGTIYYTTDGTTPTNASTAYTGPFLLTIPDTNPRELTVRAVVYDADNTAYSAVTASTFYQAGTNGSSGAGAGNGTFSEYWWATKGVSTGQATGGEVHYTLDGGTPDYSSANMDDALTFPRYGGPSTLKVKGFCPGCVPSSVRTRTIGYEKPTAPVISFDADTNEITLSATGNVTATPPVPMQTDNNNPNFGYRIYYTLDGSTPTAATGTLYTGSFQISGNTTVKAVIVAYGQYYSDVATESIVMTSAPSFSLDSDTGDLTITGPAGSALYYTLDGSTPTTESTQYTEHVNLRDNSTTGEKTVTVKAIAVVNGQDSAVQEQTYTQIKSPLHKGSLNINSGRCSVNITVPSGQTVRYTLDGSTPGASSARYDSAISYDYYDTPTVKYYASADGCIPSGIVTVHYGALAAPEAPSIDYDEDTGLVTLALTGDTRSIPLQTNNNVPDMGARIWYTLDGSTPDSTDGILWTGTPFQLPEGVTVIKAMTECYGKYDSEVNTEWIVGPPDYLRFTAEEPNSSISMSSSISTAPNLEYSLDGGRTWTEWNYQADTENNNRPIYSFDTITLHNQGDSVIMRGVNPNGFSDASGYGSYFIMTGRISASGDIQTIADGDFPSDTAVRFGALFSNCTSLISAPVLSANILTDFCYNLLFFGCSSLQSAPRLTASALRPYCYTGMFGDCVSLANPPEISATSLAEGSCISMFRNCYSLLQAPALKAEILTAECFRWMFDGCRFDMSDDGTSFNFECSVLFPQTIDGNTFSDPYSLAAYMENVYGFYNVFIDVSVNDSSMGSVLNSQMTGRLSYGQIYSPELTAIENPGYRFVKWQRKRNVSSEYEDVQGATSASYIPNIDIPGNYYYRAVFEQDTQTKMLSFTAMSNNSSISIVSGLTNKPSIE